MNKIKEFLKIILIAFILAIILVMAFWILDSKPESKRVKYECPDRDEIVYDKVEDSFVMWINCMPHPGINDEPYCSEKESQGYEQWINENCDIKVKIKLAK